jgi:hypothetical protein
MKWKFSIYFQLFVSFIDVVSKCVCSKSDSIQLRLKGCAETLLNLKDPLMHIVAY